MIFHLFGPEVIPFIKGRTISAHTNIIIEFAKLMRKHGHYVIIYGYGDYIIPECDEYVKVDIEYDLNEVNDPNWYTTSEKYRPNHEQIMQQYTKLIKPLFAQKYIKLSKNDIECTHPPPKHRIGTVACGRYKCANCITNSKQIIAECGLMSNVLDNYSTVCLMSFGGNTYSEYVVFCTHIWKYLFYQNTHYKLSWKNIKDSTIIRPWLDLEQYPFKNKPVANKFLYLARCATVKGVDYYMQICKYFQQYQFLLAGPGMIIKDNILIMDAKEYDLSDYPNLEILGILDSKQRLDILTKVTALIQPSQYEECFGMNVIESLACGTPVITTNRGSFIETVQHGKVGYLLEKGFCWQVIEQVLIQVHNINAKTCRDYVKKEFNAKVAYKRYSKFFNTI